VAELRPPTRPPSAATKSPPTEDDLDPRLVHAQPGHFAAGNLSGQLTAAENSYYRQQNYNYEQAQLHRQQQRIYISAAPAQMNGSSYAFPGRGHSNTTRVQESPDFQLPSTQTNASMQTPRFFSKLPQGQPMLPQTNASQQPSRLPQSHTPPIQYQPTQQQAGQHLARQQEQARSNPNSISHTPSSQTALLPPPTPVPTIAPNSTLSSDFAHLRGNDWSNAARQRAREIAAKITVQERDNMAQDIMQRQQSIAQQPSALASTTSMYSSTKHVPQMPPRSHSGTGLLDDPVHANAPSYANASPYADAPANLPTGTNSQHAATRGTVASTNSGWGTAVQAQDRGQISGLIPQNMLLQQPHIVPQSRDTGQTDAPQQIRDTASQQNGRSIP
jgi:hypothetical protein